MAKEIDASYLDVDSPTDRDVKFYLDPDEPTIVRIEIATQPSGKVRLVVGVDDLAKLATRMFAVAQQARGALPDRGLPQMTSTTNVQRMDGPLMGNEGHYTHDVRHMFCCHYIAVLHHHQQQHSYRQYVYAK